MSKKAAILIIIVALLSAGAFLMLNGTQATVQVETALNSLLSCTLEEAEKFDAALAPKLPAEGTGISSQGDELDALLAERYGDSMTEDCIYKLAANRTFYRSVKLAKDNNCDIQMSELKLSAESGDKNTFGFSAVLTANGAVVDSVSGTVRMTTVNSQWKADLISIN